MSYTPPTKATEYLLRHVVDMSALYAAPEHGELSMDLISDVLAGAEAFASDILAPLNRVGDVHGAKLTDGIVTTAPGFKEAYQAYVEAGWQGLSAPADIGGMGLPQTVNVAVNEMMYAANMAFGLCPMLTASATNALIAHGTDAQKQTYLPKMLSGEWSGGMNLTEAQAGSDLAALRTKARPEQDGSYKISGQKIFITWGDHDCAQNIIHLVLARLPDAPKGSRGISLFLVPKFFVDADGELGKHNNIKVVGLEHKLGIHASPTCVMAFEDATGWLVGAENNGLACMFTMMNEARLFVGVQGVAIGERAYQAALSYASERVQGRVVDGEQGAPIIGHPDVRRMLLEMKTGLMAARAITLVTAAAGDLAKCASKPEERRAAKMREALLTPIAKAYGSDMGVKASSLGVQIHGGMGFIEETGAAQYYRDARIAPIYEGTNGIQAIDLVGRKLRKDGGVAMAVMIAELEMTAQDAQQLEGLKACGVALDGAVQTLKQATEILITCDERHALSCANAYLALCGHVIGCGLLIGSVVNGKAANDPGAEAMLKLAVFHIGYILPQSTADFAQIKAGSDPVFGFPQDRLADL